MAGFLRSLRFLVSVGVSSSESHSESCLRPPSQPQPQKPFNWKDLKHSDHQSLGMISLVSSGNCYDFCVSEWILETLAVVGRWWSVHTLAPTSTLPILWSTTVSQVCVEELGKWGLALLERWGQVPFFLCWWQSWLTILYTLANSNSWALGGSKLQMLSMCGCWD